MPAKIFTRRNAPGLRAAALPVANAVVLPVGRERKNRLSSSYCAAFFQVSSASF
jgi:hypothetical protein